MAEYDDALVDKPEPAKPKRKRPEQSPELMKQAHTQFDECSEAESHNRITGEEDLKFARGGEQWPADVLAKRIREGRPCLTINKLPPFIRQVVNDARQNKPSIKIHPADSGADIETADVIGGLIRNIEYTSNAEVAYDTATECAVTMGVGYLRVGLDYAYDDVFDMDLKIDRVSNPFAVYGDPYSRAADSSDWDVAFVTDRLSEAQFKRQYGKKSTANWENDAAWGGSNWREGNVAIVAEWWTREKVDRQIELFLDKRDGSMFTCTKEQTKDPDIASLVEAGQLEFKKSRIAEGCKVTQRTMTGAEILDERVWPGRYIPIIPVYGDEFDIKGKRYFRSLIHNAIDAQRMLNYWRSVSTELVALAPKVPYIGEEGAFAVDTEKWNSAASTSWPYIQYAKGKAPPMRQPLDTGGSAGAMSEALSASDDMKAIIGLYDASLGARSNETSGRAILARQREGDVSTFHFMDNMARAVRHTGRVLIDLIPHVYDAPRVVRVMGEDRKDRAVQINQEFDKVDEKTGEPVMQPVEGPGGRPMMGPDNEPLMEAVKALHDLTAGKYDLTVTTGPSFTTRREEAALQMTQMIQAYPDAAPIIGDKLAQNLDWPGADEIAERFAKMLPPQLQGEQQIPPEVQQMIEMGKAEIERLTAENAQLKQDQSAAMGKVEADTNVQHEKLKADFALGMAKIKSDRDLKVMTEPGSTLEVGPDGQPIAKSGIEIAIEGIGQIAQMIQMGQQQAAMQMQAMMGQIQLGQQQTAAQVTGTGQAIIEVMSAPVKAVRGPDGKIDLAVRVMPGATGTVN